MYIVQAVVGLESHLAEREDMKKTEVVKEKVMPYLKLYKLQEAHEEMVQVGQLTLSGFSP